MKSKLLVVLRCCNSHTSHPKHKVVFFSFLHFIGKLKAFRFVLGKKGRGKRKASKMSEEDSNCWEMNAKFKNMTYWKHDSLPSQHDAFLRSFHWLDVVEVAEVLHQPVGAEDLFSASIELEKFRQ
ncbi:hypothetical protein UlMin_019675 [Ulmus minor]